MPKRKTLQSDDASIADELKMLDKKSYQKYLKEHNRKLEELKYQNSNGFYPPRPWYEE